MSTLHEFEKAFNDVGTKQYTSLLSKLSAVPAQYKTYSNFIYTYGRKTMMKPQPWQITF